MYATEKQWNDRVFDWSVFGGSRGGLCIHSRGALQAGTLRRALFPLTSIMRPNSVVVGGKSTVLLHCHETNHEVFCATILEEVMNDDSETLMTVGTSRIVHSTMHA